MLRTLALFQSSSPGLVRSSSPQLSNRRAAAAGRLRKQEETKKNGRGGRLEVGGLTPAGPRSRRDAQAARGERTRASIQRNVPGREKEDERRRDAEGSSFNRLSRGFFP